MPEKSLTGKSIKNSYEGLLHFNDGGLAGGTGVTQRKRVYDGLGSATCLEIASNSFKINGSTEMAGDVYIASGDSSVYISSASAAIELRDGAGSDNPYIDFKTSGSEDYDCRIIKSSNGLQLWTGGNSNKQLAAHFTSGADLLMNGDIRIGKKSSDGVDTTPTQPYCDLKATRINKIDRLYIYGNDFVHIVGSENDQRKTIATLNKTGMALGRGTAAPNKTLDVFGTLRLKISGTEAAGKVLTCTNTSGDTEWRNAAASFKFTYGVDYVETFTNQLGNFGEGSNFFTVYPPSGYVMADLVAFMPSIAVIHFNGTVDENDSLRCGWIKTDATGQPGVANPDRIKVSVQNTEQRSAPAANWLAVWSK